MATPINVVDRRMLYDCIPSRNGYNASRQEQKSIHKVSRVRAVPAASARYPKRANPRRICTRNHVRKPNRPQPFIGDTPKSTRGIRRKRRRMDLSKKSDKSTFNRLSAESTSSDPMRKIAEKWCLRTPFWRWNVQQRRPWWKMAPTMAFCGQRGKPWCIMYSV